MEEVIKHKQSGFNFNKKLSFSSHKEMKLIGLGTRYKLLFVIYGIGYYDSNPEYNKEKIFVDNSTKGLILKFYRGVSKETMIQSLKESIFLRSNNEETKKYVDYLELILNSNIDNINYKDVINLIWENEKLYIYYNNKNIGNIDSELFSKIVFRCYLDKDSVCNDLICNI